MSKASRDKGLRAERELRNELAAELGDGVIRELGASRDGGHDLTGAGPFAIEVKRREKLELRAWWQQACDQADRVGMVPALAYRQSRQPWVFVVPLGVLRGNAAPWDRQALASVHMDGFVLIVRELESAKALARQVRSQLEAS